MTARIANTFNALTKSADFKSAAPEKNDIKSKSDAEKEGDGDDTDESDADDNKNKRRANGLRPEFQYVLQIQLPSNGSEETYLNIFNAIRKTFQ